MQITISNRYSYTKKIKQLMFLFILVVIPEISIAQNNKITVSFKNAEIKSILNHVQDKLGYDFLYANNELGKCGNVSLNMKDVSVKEIMEKLQQICNFSYKIEDNTIVITKSKINKGQYKQVIKGIVTDRDSKSSLPGVNIIIVDSNPIMGAVTDENGNFKLTGISPGRHSLQVSMIGYETLIYKDIVVTSSKAVFVEISMGQNIKSLEMVIIKPEINKESAINSMAMVGGRMLSVEEANRYAGGFDDPARLASSFAGVAGGVSDNGIVVRGNAPKSLQWKMEGVEIPNPNHFADLLAFGGGGITAMSSQLLANSDFFNGAFPAEYSNALSGVFDMNMRVGNNEDYEHTVQAGVLGIDLASEGPVKKGSRSSYLINYRYSTFGLISKITNNIEGIKYQDLSYKFNFPTAKMGVFSLWGIGLIDGSVVKAKPNKVDWKYLKDKKDFDATQYMGASGLSHKIFFNDKKLLKTTLATTRNGLNWKINMLNDQLNLVPYNQIQNTNSNYIFQSVLNNKISTRHTNKSGILITGLQYNMHIKNAITINNPLTTIIDESGFSTLLSAYSNSLFKLNNRLNANIGLTSQFFTLNNNYTLEPRVGLRWQWTEKHQIGIGYGLHSRLEKLNFFFTKDPISNQYNNKNMDFTKAHHIVVCFSTNLNENLLFKVEPYYQHLFNVPVIANSSFSFINLKNDWFVNSKFENTGKGTNWGIDLTLEKFLTKGYYYLIAASIFKSEYMGGDNIWRSTKFNRNYLFNLLGGKEWALGDKKQNTLGLNIRFSYQGGEHYTPYLLSESIQNEQVVFDETSAYSEQIAPAFLIHFTVNYIINKSKSTHELSFKVLNATSYGDFQGFQYNYIDQTVDEIRETFMIPNLSYKINF